jgi:hypothetical protein
MRWMYSNSSVRSSASMTYRARGGQESTKLVVSVVATAEMRETYN